jgi:hypothetical protein
LVERGWHLLEGAEMAAFIRNAMLSHSHQTCTAKMRRDP